ncbi:MAG: GTPase [Eubacteriales bacterium]
MNNKIWDVLEREIMTSEMDESTKRQLIENVNKIKDQTLNILFMGATGVGKSSTINAIFNTDVAKVGYGVDPQTMNIEKYEIENMVLWDTQGLGDSPENDKKYAHQIANILTKKDCNGEALIDLVMVIIDGSNRDMRTSFELIENIIIPYVQDEKRILIGINQCDIAMKGRYWNNSTNEPEETLISFLKEKVESVKNRVNESTGVHVNPIYYSALHHYNISKVLSNIVKNMPENKRLILADNINSNPEIWKNNDGLADYNLEIQSEMKISLANALDGAAKGAVAGATVGALVPIIGPIIGATIGAALGFLGGLFRNYAS